MQQIKKGRSEWMYPVRLFREDVEELIEIFRAKCQRITISDLDYRYDSLDEVKAKRGNKVFDLEIKGESPYVELSFGRGLPLTLAAPQAKILLRTIDTTDEADVLFLTIKDFLGKRRWVLGSILGTPMVAWGLFLLGVFTASVLVVSVKKPRLYAITLILLVPVSLYFGFTVPNLNLFSLSLLRRTEVSSFWAKNRDDIIKILIGAAVGTIATLIVQHFSKQ